MANKGTSTPQEKAAQNKSSAAGKRAGQGARTAQSAPPEARGQNSKPVTAERKRASVQRTSPRLKIDKQNCPEVDAEVKRIVEQERQSLIKRLIAWLRAALSFKKGERNEFRYNYDEGHPGYVFKEENGKLKSFGVTHKGTTFGVANMPLVDNPDATDKDAAYIRNGVITSKKKRNGGRMKNMKLSQKDKAKVKSKKRHYKKVAKQQEAKNKKSK